MKINISEEMNEKVKELGTFYSKMYEELGGKECSIYVEIEKYPEKNIQGETIGLPIILNFDSEKIYDKLNSKLLGYVEGTVMDFMGAKEFIIDNDRFDELMSELFKFNIYYKLLELIYTNNNIERDMAIIDSICINMNSVKILDIIKDIAPDITEYIKKELSDDTLPHCLPSDLLKYILFRNDKMLYDEMNNFLIKIYKNVLHMIIKKYREGK